MYRLACGWGVSLMPVLTKLERTLPLVRSQGHVHELRGSWKNLRSTDSDPGNEYSGVLRATVLTLGAGKGIDGSQLVAS